MNIEELKDWGKNNLIEQRTVKTFKQFLKNYEIDNPIEYCEVFGKVNINELKYQIHTISMNLGNWPECSYNTVSAPMWAFYNEKQICSYKILYTFDGVPEDDFFDVP